MTFWKKNQLRCEYIYTTTKKKYPVNHMSADTLAPGVNWAHFLSMAKQDLCQIKVLQRYSILLPKIKVFKITPRPLSETKELINPMYTSPHFYTSHPGPRFNIKMLSYLCRKSHCGDKTVVRSSYLHNGISYTGKMTSLYWFSPQALSELFPHGISPSLNGPLLSIYT